MDQNTAWPVLACNIYTMYSVLIKTMGRTGSHRIAEHFRQAGLEFVQIHYDGCVDKQMSDAEPDPNTAQVILSHDVGYLPDKPERFWLILSTRSNRFDQYCSFRVAEATQQWCNYTHTTEPITVTDQDIAGCIHSYRTWDQQVIAQAEQHPWLNFTVIAREELAGLDNLFPLTKLNEERISTASPHDYTRIIRDYDTLNERYGDKYSLEEEREILFARRAQR